MTEPALSIVIPSYNRPGELRRSLEGFAAQTASSDDFEVIVVDDGSDEDYAPVIAATEARVPVRLLLCPHRGVSAARNAGIEAARAPWLVLLDDDLAPEPSLVADCLAFHAAHPDRSDAMLLHFDADAGIAATPLFAYLNRDGRWLDLPGVAGVYHHAYFWGGALTCKRALFELGRYRPGLDATEDTELGSRLAGQLPLRVHYEPITRLTFTRTVTIEAIERREYLLAYHRCFRAMDTDWLAGAYDGEPRYHEPARHLIGTAGELAILHDTARELEALLATPLDPERLALHRAELHAAYDRLIAHAMARGWRDAERGRPPASAVRPVAPAALVDPLGQPADAAGVPLPHARWRTAAGRPLLTASLIVRNEAAHIADCLASLAPLVDEVVIVDTGSTDGTDAIARACGAIVVSQPWADDFSAPRNRSLELVTGEWVLYIDADERVVPGDVEALRAQLRGPDFEGLMVQLRSHAGATAFWEIRLFRNDPGIRFQGVIHETVWPGLLATAERTGRTVGHSALALDHLGYAGDQRRKHERNLPMLLRSLENEPWKVFNWCHLAEVYTGLGREAEAEDAWREALARARAAAQHRLTDSGAFAGYIDWLQARGRPFDDVLAEGLALYPANLYLRWLDGARRLAAEDYAGAAAAFQAVLAGADPDVRDRSVGYGEWLFGPRTMAPLAGCLLALDRPAEAARLFTELERLEPGRAEFRVKRRLAAALAARGPDAYAPVTPAARP